MRVAVPAMLALCICAFKLIEKHSPDCECAFFADNMSLFATGVQHLIQGLAVLQRFVRCFQMQISPSKSWLWGNRPNLRTQLRQIQLGGHAIPVILHANDMGVQQIYSKKWSKELMSKRLAKAKQTMKTIQKIKLPRNARERLTQSAGITKFTYGASIHNISLTDLHGARVWVSKALQRTGAGVNAFLSCTTVDLNLDPELTIIQQRFQLWRRFLKLFPEFRDMLCKGLQSLGTFVRRKITMGPISPLNDSVHVGSPLC